ncbi:sulfate ABC transporter permease subunit CysT [Roseomonas sp. KE2513]|uniref:sulfate ABC transporter permease subunit CysT n=1 Tax=Roseomonas sp. KE2513 TaxID=2479202 RepID=UPI0028156E1B|nr:sulfate ABC transporter permease subunit CysT [Roseomonas sp. KE2513]
MSASLLAGRGARARAIPGFRTTLAVTLLWLGVIVLIPLAALALRPLELGPAGLIASLSEERVVAALGLSFGAALLAALLNLPLGLLLAWAVVRLRFPGRGILDAALDLPFALPTAVAGIALTAIAAPNGWVGAPLADLFGWKIAFTRAGVVLALMFVSLPFIVRTVEPVLRDMAAEAEEAAATLGATRAQTVLRVVLPGLLPALLTGFSLAFARSVGEYGSVIFIAGNLPMLTEIAPLLIVIRLEQYDYAGAAAVGLAMLVLSFLLLLAIELVQRRLRRGRR